MEEKKGQRKKILRESFITILVLAVLAPGLAASERRGAEVVVTKNDGTVIRGELLAVKGTDLLIMDESASGGVSVSLTDAMLVKVVNRGKVGLILGGALIGGSLGGGLGYAVESGHHEPLSGIDKAAGAIVGGGIGLLAGGIVGVVLSSSKELPVIGTDPNSVNQMASQLRRLARDRS